MRKRFAVIGVLAAVIAVALAATTLVPAASKVTSNRFTVGFPKSEPDAVIDVGKKGFGAGDVFVFRGKLTRSGNTVGFVWAKATLLRRKGGLVHMEATVRIFGKGKLEAAGILYFDRQHQGTLSIAGGTADYRRAAGTVTTVQKRMVRLHFRVITA
jgi:hypothetical protein